MSSSLAMNSPRELKGLALPILSNDPSSPVAPPTINTPGANEPKTMRCMEKNHLSGKNMDEFNVQCILTHGRSLEDLPSSETPYAIIKYGPTGSGKGSANVQKEIAMLGVPLDDYAVFEIDSLVESAKEYRNRTLSIRNKRRKSMNGTYSNKNMFKNLGNAYANTRKYLSKKMISNLDLAIQGKKNFIFETTGQFFSGKSPFAWLLDKIKELGKGAYKVVLIYPLVSPGELAKRVTSRAEQQATKANKPFYRAIDVDTLEPGTLYAKENLSHFILPEIYVKNIHKVVILWNE